MNVKHYYGVEILLDPESGEFSAEVPTGHYTSKTLADLEHLIRVHLGPHVYWRSVRGELQEARVVGFLGHGRVEIANDDFHADAPTSSLFWPNPAIRAEVAQLQEDMATQQQRIEALLAKLAPVTISGLKDWMP